MSLNSHRKISIKFLLLFKIVAIGIVPYLLPGVGLPAEKRSKFLQYLLGTEKEKDILEVSDLFGLNWKERSFDILLKGLQFRLTEPIDLISFFSRNIDA